MTHSCWCGRRSLLIVGMLALLAGVIPSLALGQVPAAQTASVTASYPVQTSVRGYLAALFVADGSYVRRGQLVAKLACANGSAAYVNAPATGRLSFVQPACSGMLASHTILGTIQVTFTH
jgi:multidrug resistance efflux pump